MTAPSGTLPTYSITHLASMSGVAAHTLRWYERKGLLDDVPRDATGRRRYQPHHARQLQLISDLQVSGMTLAEIRDYLRHIRSRPCGASRQVLRRQRDKLSKEITALQAALARIEHLLTVEGDQGIIVNTCDHQM